MKPWLHAKISVKKFGGKPEDYIDIHNWFDQTKAHVPDARHRLVLHNSFGVYLAEQQFGKMVQKEDGSWVRTPIIVNSNGKEISVRDIAEQHVLDDLGTIPTLGESLEHVTLPEDISGKIKRIKLSSTNIRIVD